MECTAKVFLLTGEWVESDGELNVIFYGRSPKLGAVELIFEKIQCCFFVPLEVDLPEINVTFKRKKGDLRTFHGKAVESLYFNTYSDLRVAQEKFKAAGVTIFEGDIKPHERFLMEHFINGQLAVQGEAVQKEKLISFLNPKIKPCEVNTHLKVASLDIECGVASERLYSIGVHLSGIGEEEEICFMLGKTRESLPNNLEIYPSEQGVLNAFLDWFLEKDPDIIIGWHVIGFDFDYLVKKCESFYMDLNISRNGKKPIFTSPASGGHYATISGRVVLDGPPCLRDAGYSFDNFTLETVSQTLLGEGKIITTSKDDKIAEIEDLFENNKAQLGAYNLQDCRLVAKIFKEIDLINLMVNRVKSSGVLMPSIGIYNLSFDHFYLPRLHRMGFVAPTYGDTGRHLNNYEVQVMANHGIFDNVCQFKISYLVCRLIEAFRIDPLAKIRSEFEEASHSPGLIKFSKKSHILPQLFNKFDDILEENSETSFGKAVKITQESILEALRSPTNRLYSYDLIAAIEESVNWLLMAVKKYLTSEGYVLCAASAENLYIQLKEQEISTVLTQVDLLANRISKHLSDLAKKEFEVELLVDLEFVAHYSSFILLDNNAIYKQAVADIRFAGYVNESNKTVLHGLKISGADWTELAVKFQQGFFDKIFRNENVEEWVKEFVAALKRGDFDQELSYTKKLTKAVEEYTGNIPPHVKAAKLLKNPGKFITYIITLSGPVPVQLPSKDVDYQHYLDKQLAPIADSYFKLKGQKFENLFKAQQLSLFDF